MRTSNLIDLKQEQKAALDKAESILTAAEQGHRALTANETSDYETSMRAFKELGVTVKARQEMNTIMSTFPNGMLGVGTPSGTFNAPPSADFSPLSSAVSRNPEYASRLSPIFGVVENRHLESLPWVRTALGASLCPAPNRTRGSATPTGLIRR
jgi:hypothetical protein